MERTMNPYTKVNWLASRIKEGAEQHDRDCIWSHLDELNDIIHELGERQ